MKLTPRISKLIPEPKLKPELKNVGAAKLSDATPTPTPTPTPRSCNRKVCQKRKPDTLAAKTTSNYRFCSGCDCDCDCVGVGDGPVWPLAKPMKSTVSCLYRFVTGSCSSSWHSYNKGRLNLQRGRVFDWLLATFCTQIQAKECLFEFNMSE